LENFDGAGQYRKRENGVAIDTSGSLDKQPFTDAAGLGKALHDNPATTSCLVRSVFRYGVGRPLTTVEEADLQHLDQAFAAGGYRVPELIRAIALSPTFYAAYRRPLASPRDAPKLAERDQK